MCWGMADNVVVCWGMPEDLQEGPGVLGHG